MNVMMKNTRNAEIKDLEVLSVPGREDDDGNEISPTIWTVHSRSGRRIQGLTHGAARFATYAEALAAKKAFEAKEATRR